MRRLLLVWLLAGCGSASSGVTPSSTAGPGSDPAPSPGDVDLSVPTEEPDLAAPTPAPAPPDRGHPGGDDGGISDAAPAPAPPSPSDGGTFMSPGSSDPPVERAPPTSISPQNLFGGLDVLDVSVDQGGGVWAVTSSTVYYLPPGRSAPFTYDQSSGLARGQYTWVDTWFSPGTYPVTFSSVAGATAGQAVIGEIGTIGDRLEVSPSTGAVSRIDNMQVTMANTSPAEYPEHLKRVVAVWRVALDLNGTYHGTAYLGGFHGFYAFHGLTQSCGCLAFEEHQHYITATTIGGADVKGLAFTSLGDVLEGDRDFVTLLQQRSSGPFTGLFDHDFSWGIDVFPGVRDEVTGLAADAGDGVYVASDGNGLAYLAPVTHAAQYWSASTTLPQNHLRGVAVDAKGNVWVATAAAGVARYSPGANTWTYYTGASGLPSSTTHSIYFDKIGGGKIYLATTNGVAVLAP